MIPLTRLDGIPDKHDLILGMAYFAGTGPEGTTCGTCEFRGYMRKAETGNHYHVASCRMYRSFSGGKHGRRLRKDTPSCKYYEPKVTR